MRNRIISMILIVCMILGLLSGCDIIIMLPTPDPEPKEPEYKVTLSSSKLDLDVGEIFKLTANISPSSDDIIVNWKTSDSSIVSVNDGVVTAIAKGSAVVEVVLPNGNSAYCVVTVLPVDAPPTDNDDDGSGENNENEGGNNGEGTGGNEGGELVYDGSDVTITFYHTMSISFQETLNETIAEFNKIYPNITVEHKSYGDHYGLYYQIMSEIAVGEHPHIAYCHPDHLALYKTADAILTLDEFINSTQVIERVDGSTEILGFDQKQNNDFIAGFYNDGRTLGDGKTYSLPLCKYTDVLYYNVEALVAAGVVDADGNAAPPKTWEEMAVACEKLKAWDPKCIPLGYDSESNWFITMCEQYGSSYTSSNGENFLFNCETNRNFVKMFREWYQKKWVTTEELSGGYCCGLFIDGASSHNNIYLPTGTRCYMCIASTSGSTYHQPRMTNGTYEFTVGIAPMPQVDIDNPKVISQGHNITIFKNDNPQEVIATWLFAKYLTTDINFQANMSMLHGGAPVIKSVIEDPRYADFLAMADTRYISSYAIKVALAQEGAYFVSPVFNGSSVAREQVGLLLQRCFTINEGDIDAQIKKAFEDCVSECKNQTE